MDIKYCISIQGTAAENEDSLGYMGDYFWVIDGATDLFDARESIGYSVSEVIDLLSKTLPKHCDSSKTLLQNFQEALAELAQLIGLEKLSREKAYKLPTFAFVFGKLSGNQLDYLLLGDCVLLVNEQELTDHRVDNFFEKGKEEVAKVLASEHPQTPKTILQDIRKMLNQPNGYWIGSLDALGLSQALSGTLEITSQQIIVMSDGFYDFYKEHSTKTIEELIEMRKESNIIDPIYGKKDDASILVIEV